MAKTSGGVEASLFSQNGQNVASLVNLLETKIRRLHGRGISHDYPAAGKDVFPHLGHVCANLSRIPLTSLFAATWHFNSGDLFESRDGLQQPFSQCLLNLLVCTRAVQSFQGLAAFI